MTMDINGSSTNNNASHLYNNGAYYDEPYRTFSIVVDSLLILPAVFGNLVLIYYVSRTKELRNIGNYLVINLALDDIFMGVFIIPYDIYVLYNISLGQNKLLCLLRFFLHNMNGSNSSFNLFIISLERYIALLHPFNYGRYVTCTRILIVVICSRIISLVVAGVPLMGVNNWKIGMECDPSRIWVDEYSLFCSLWGIVIIMLTSFCYGRVIKVAFKHIDAVIKQRESLDTQGNTNHKADIRKTKMMALIFGLFLLYWSPFSILLFFQRIYKDNYTLAVAKCYALTFIKSNCFINFVVYLFRSKNFRKNLRCSFLNNVSPQRHEATAMS
ncbi:adenosine receptor A2a-like [Argonauta hians]